jgi:hypothetical protein
MRINIETAGISPNTIIRYARRAKISPDKMSKARIPAARRSNSWTRGQRKESESFGLFGPGITESKDKSEVEANFGGEVIVEENERPCRLFATLEGSKTVSACPERNVARVGEVLVIVFLVTDLDKLVEQRTIMLPIKDIGGRARSVLMLSAILAFLCDLTIGSKRNETGDDRNVREFLPWFAVGSETRFFAILVRTHG